MTPTEQDNEQPRTQGVITRYPIVAVWCAPCTKYINKYSVRIAGK